MQIQQQMQFQQVRAFIDLTQDSKSCDIGCSPRAEIRYLDEEGNMFVMDEVQDSGVPIPQQTCMNMRKSSVKPEQTNEKTNITLTSQKIILDEDRPNEANLHNAESAANNVALLYSEQLEEAKRILNASSYLEAFQVCSSKHSFHL